MDFVKGWNGCEETNPSVHLDQGIDAHFSSFQMDVMMIYIITTWTMRAVYTEKNSGIFFLSFWIFFENVGKIQRKNIWAEKL